MRGLVVARIRADANINRLLDLLQEHEVRATFFWLGWMAEKTSDALAAVRRAGHEIASHSYSHVRPQDVGPAGFKDDIERAKKSSGRCHRPARVVVFAGRVQHPRRDQWAFEVVKETGYEYDSSVFPAYHSPGCRPPLASRTLLDSYQSRTVDRGAAVGRELLGLQAFSVWGGYLRLSPQWLIQWGVRRFTKPECR